MAGEPGELSGNRQKAMMGNLGTETSCLLLGWGPGSGLSQQSQQSQQRLQLGEGSHQRNEKWISPGIVGSEQCFSTMSVFLSHSDIHLNSFQNGSQESSEEVVDFSLLEIFPTHQWRNVSRSLVLPFCHSSSKVSSFSCLISHVSLGEAEKLDNFFMYKRRVLLFTAWDCYKNRVGQILKIPQNGIWALISSQ